MSDLKVIRWLRSIDEKLDAMKKDRDRSLAELDVEIQAHEERLDGHDEQIGDVTRRVDRLETRFDRTLHSLRTGKKPPPAPKRVAKKG